MNQSTQAHFGFVAYTDRAGQTPSDTFSAPNIAINYQPGGTGNFPLPNIQLNQQSDNLSDIQQTLPTLVSLGGRNIGDALQQAVNQLQQNGRPGSKRAIILIAAGTQFSNSNPNGLTDPRSVAAQAQKDGIAIFTVGYTTGDSSNLTALLNDNNSDPAAGGIAAIAGNGGQYYLVTNTNNFGQAFSNIGRQLVTLMQSGP